MDWKFLDSFNTYHIFGNAIVNWLLALSFAIVAILTLRISSDWALKKILDRNKNIQINQQLRILFLFIETLVTRMSWMLIIAVALYAFVLPLDLSQKVTATIQNVAAALVITQLVIWIASVARMTLSSYFMSGTNGVESAALSVSSFVIQVFIWIVGLIIILENIGVDVSALVTGLGIGGIAVALAVQNILGDLFASLSIVLDKPVEVGDFIVSGEFKGTVEKIGIKTTRLRSLSGEQIIVANSDLLSSRIRNFKRMVDRRVVFSVGLTYNTPTVELRLFPEKLRDFVVEHADTRFDRAHFFALGDSSLQFEVVYFVLSADYNRYMDIQQIINLKIIEYCNGRGIQFAFPPTSLYVEKHLEKVSSSEPNVALNTDKKTQNNKYQTA